MKKIIAITPLLFLLFSCATGYHPMSLTGGFEDFKLANDTYSVKFLGNEYTNRDQAYKYALRRSAELTTQNGYRYFKIIDSNSSVSTKTYETPVTETTTTDSKSDYHHRHRHSTTSTTIISGGQEVTVEIPTTYMKIKMYKNNIGGALDAEVILSNFKK
ncbi:CC0125/CC1285 family lipoprotein [Legionella drancourtii]|uniref:Lipoprotein n=1 Tax=Legionella drancourtii LLAP12 TaxID=658187 RepID=G9EJB6_9GAMM|nr:hypothetical protein [Legionella drancourtii]EHL32682.1 hypothetical protein LDG_5275 [Legionella drancourtii LLAP12]